MVLSSLNRRVFTERVVSRSKPMSNSPLGKVSNDIGRSRALIACFVLQAAALVAWRLRAVSSPSSSAAC
jgi:hypothetical protein